MIEVVGNAKTIYGIQRKGGKLAAIQVDSSQLLKWIKEHNKQRYVYCLNTINTFRLILLNKPSLIKTR